MSLPLRRITLGSGPPLLIAHGLFGSARNWGALQKRLADTFKVTAVDMRNHGESPRADKQDYTEMAADLDAAIEERSHVLGHSMGGKAAMVLALTRPEKVDRLIVADIAPVAYGHTQRGYIEAMRGIDLSRVETRGDADRLLEETVPEPGVRAFLLQSLDVKARSWRLGLDTLEREMERIVGFPEVEGRFDGPTLFLAGRDSSYVLPEHRERIRDLFPSARIVRLQGAGHWLHAEKPRETEAAIRSFLLPTP